MKTIRPVPIQKNLDRIAELESQAVRITVGPGGRCFVMPDGQLLTIKNEQPIGSTVEHVMFVQPLRREDAEDFYGFVGI